MVETMFAVVGTPTFVRLAGKSGRWWMAWGKVAGDSAAPAERALRDCEKNHGERCFLYAVDESVVYDPPTPSSVPDGSKTAVQ
jgi:hypothetical protein